VTVKRIQSRFLSRCAEIKRGDVYAGQVIICFLALHLLTSVNYAEGVGYAGAQCCSKGLIIKLLQAEAT